MNTQDQIKALAELDGWKYHTSGVAIPPHGQVWSVPNYLESYDAIIPLLQKSLIHIYQWLDFEREFGKVAKGVGIMPLARDALRSTPSQLSEALLRATGKWK